MSFALAKEGPNEPFIILPLIGLRAFVSSRTSLNLGPNVSGHGLGLDSEIERMPSRSPYCRPYHKGRTCRAAAAIDEFHKSGEARARGCAVVEVEGIEKWLVTKCTVPCSVDRRPFVRAASLSL